jgi:hypothetical protein
VVSATGIFITNLTYLRTISRVVVPLALALESAYTPRPIEKPQINWGVSIGAHLHNHLKFFDYMVDEIYRINLKLANLHGQQSAIIY